MSTQSPKLFMLMLGCTPPPRRIEQHDMFFSIADSLKDLKQEILDFWPEAGEKIHVDAWREVTEVDGYQIQVVAKGSIPNQTNNLFFMNLGGYKPGEFDEPHYKMLIVAEDKASAIQQAKQTAFYKHTGFEGAASHIDDKYGVDVDDAFEIVDVLSEELKLQYDLKIELAEGQQKDEINLGYLKFSKI
ncbi:DUF1543 domain-containing protein [Pedobacter sp. KBW06]|uniref:DUF1543 domain-containing protein n=1 Tax=Pedobacter sp. KBW06 TaxID=2153359 RepID=UPI000F599051|nr:DUF1543 domain-containing protein [Pedobacter sp. KBW06]RQO72427.1 DUF1543 domain-containing protein [Pedobacter sp. KBW06]